MKRILLAPALLAATLAIAGCAITQDVRPVPTTDIPLLCVKRNPEVFMSEFVKELMSQVEGRGIRTRIYEGTAPADCRYRLEYTANWRWDLAMYLVYADLRVYDGEVLVGQANYDARAGGARLDKFGATAEKMKGLVNELFARK